MKIDQPPWMPDILYKTIKNQQEQYDKGDSDFTVTELISPPHQAALKRKYGSDIEESADDRIWSMFGAGLHKAIETACGTGITEKRFFIKRMGYVISGQADYIESKMVTSDGFIQKTIYDWKVTSAWSVLDGPKPEWEQQLQLLALLFANQTDNHYQVQVNESILLRIVAFYRDWSEKQMMNNMDYPRHPYGKFGFPLWSSSDAEIFLINRINAHLKADSVVNQKASVCTPEERWQKPDQWAVKKIGNKNATKVFDSEKDASNFIGGKPLGDKTYEIEFRQGEDTRCKRYCNVARFCKYGKQYFETQSIKEAA